MLETPERADLGEPGREEHMTTEELGVLHELVEELEPIRSPKMPPDGMSPDPTLKSQHKLLRYCCIICSCCLISFLLSDVVLVVQCCSCLMLFLLSNIVFVA